MQSFDIFELDIVLNNEVCATNIFLKIRQISTFVGNMYDIPEQIRNKNWLNIICYIEFGETIKSSNRLTFLYSL